MKNFSSVKARIRRYLPLYLMTVPAFVYLFINNFMPMGGLVLAFKSYKATDGIWGSAWAGFENFRFLLENDGLPAVLRNTLCYNITFILVNMVLGVTLAILITEVGNPVLKKIAQSSVLFPFVVSIIIVSYMVRSFLDPAAGLVNGILKALGQAPVSWYDTPKYWPFILVFVNAWKNVGYSCILYIASILGIDASLMESATLDGASKLQRIRYITLPFLRPTIITVVLLSIGRIFNSDFGLFYQVPQNSGLLTDVTQTIDTFVYRALMLQGNVGISAAASFFQSCMGFLLILFFNAVTNKISKENALF